MKEQECVQRRRLHPIAESLPDPGATRTGRAGCFLLAPVTMCCVPASSGSSQHTSVPFGGCILSTEVSGRRPGDADVVVLLLQVFMPLGALFPNTLRCVHLQ